MARDEMPRCQRQRDARQHHGGERGQAEKMLGAFQRGAYLGTRIAHIFHLFSQRQPGFQPVALSGHLLCITRHHQAVTDTAAFQNQPAGGQVGRIQDHARRKTGEADRLVHKTHHPRRYPQMQLADADLVAQLQTQTLHQALIRPQRAARGDHAIFAPDNMLRAIVDDDLPAQGIPLLHRHDVSQQILVPGRHHAGKGIRFHHAQSALQRSIAILLWQWPRRGDAQIRTDQAGRLLLQRQPYAVREQANRGDAAHRQHQRDQQHAPFTGAPVAAQQTEGKAEEVHCLFTRNTRYVNDGFGLVAKPRRRTRQCKTPHPHKT